MPRPAPKRSRTAGKPPKKATTEESAQNDSAKSPKNPERGPALDPRTLREQTPLAKSYENAIDSSPTGDRPGTGSRPGTASRPPTRSRGYSSTLSFAGRTVDNSRIPGTPGFDNSVLSNFRRRPRQQSILHHLQADDDGSSELDDDDFLGGLSPNDESTPLNLSRGKSLLVKPSKESPSPVGSPLSCGGSGSRKRRRMTEDIQVPQSSVEMVEGTPTATPVWMVKDTPIATPLEREGSPESQGAEEIVESKASDHNAKAPESEDEEESEDEHEDEHEDDPEEDVVAVTDVESTPRAQRFPDILSQTMLPPASSPAYSTQPDTSTPQPVQRKKSKAPTHLSTANLQEKLLPRRRRRHRVGNDLSDSDDQHDAASGDEDELNYPSHSRRPVRGRAGKSKPKPLATVHNPKNPKPKQAEKTKSKPPNEPATYSRSRLEATDKDQDALSSSPLSSPPESDVSGSESIQTEPTRCTSDELRAALKKFAEVDQWKMEFEDVSASEI